MIEIDGLPAEMLIRIFHCLPPRDRKKIVLVSKIWRDIGEDPTLWNWCRVVVRQKGDINSFSIRRLQQIQEICLNTGGNWEAGDWETIFEVVVRLPMLKKLDFLGDNYLSTVGPELFGSVVTRIEDVNLINSKLTNDQKRALFTAMDLDSQMKKLNLNGNNLYSLEPELFARVVTRLESANLGGTNLTNEQKLALFMEMSLNSQMKKLDLACNNLSDVDSELFARVVTRLEDLNLCFTNITNQQKVALFTKISKNTQLKKLNLACNNLSSVHPELFAWVVTRLEDFNLCFTNITNDQSQSLFTAILQNSQLKKLNLSSNDLSSIDPTVLATAVARLEDLDLRFTNLSPEQLTCILAHVQEDTNIKKLFLRGNKTANIEVGVVKNAREKLGDGLDLNSFFGY